VYTAHHTPSPLAREGVRLSAPLGEPSRSGRGGRPTHQELLARAKWMRANPTDAERRMWSLLRNRRFAGYKFKRQVVIDRYIADFVSFDQRLIVEADGSQHVENAYDARRDAYLKDQGFNLLRFWNIEILKNRDSIQEAIWHALQISPLPSRERVGVEEVIPPSPPEGEGGVKRRERGRAASAAQKTQTLEQAHSSDESLGAQTRAAPLPSAATRLPPSPARGEGV
jgi:very-short-patch-repair endonuclease